MKRDLPRRAEFTSEAENRVRFGFVLALRDTKIPRLEPKTKAHDLIASGTMEANVVGVTTLRRRRSAGESAE